MQEYISLQSDKTNGHVYINILYLSNSILGGPGSVSGGSKCEGPSPSTILNGPGSGLGGPGPP